MTRDKNNYLVLVRHGQSEWNEKNLFTGWKNPPLTELGKKEAKRAGMKIKSLILDFYLHSALLLQQQTKIKREVLLHSLSLIQTSDQVEYH